MKVAILTLPVHINYGGILQAYALQTVLRKMGHEVTILHHVKQNKDIPIWHLPLKFAKRLIKKILIDHHTIVFEKQRRDVEYPILTQHIKKFIDTHLHLRVIEQFTDIQNNDYDAFIVGSDQVWRPVYFKQMWNSPIQNAFLDFAKSWGDIKRIAYAASFGTDKWEYDKKETFDCAKLLKLFNCVSVRESSGIDICAKHFGIKPFHALDPTMLLTKEDYQELITNISSPPDQKDFLLTYILDETKEKKFFVKKIAQERRLAVKKIHVGARYTNRPIEERICPSIEEWLLDFHNASMVITDSFHACVFSILFQKPFIAVGNKKRGMSRFISLLSMFGLEKNLLYNVSNYDAEYSYTIDNKIHDRLAELRMYSTQLLASVLA